MILLEWKSRFSVAKQVPLLVKVTNNYNRAIFSIYLCNCHCQIGDY